MWKSISYESPKLETEQVKELRAKLDKCVEVLDMLYILVTHETDLPKGAANGVVSDDGRDEGVWRAGEILEEARIALFTMRGSAEDKSPSEQMLEGQLSKLRSQLTTEKDRRRALVASCEGLIKSEDHPVGWSSQWRWGVWSIFRRDVAEAKMETTDDPKGKTTTPERKSESICSICTRPRDSNSNCASLKCPFEEREPSGLRLLRRLLTEIDRWKAAILEPRDCDGF
jgi:hypothetical protein